MLNEPYNDTWYNDIHNQCAKTSNAKNTTLCIVFCELQCSKCMVILILGYCSFEEKILIKLLISSRMSYFA